MSLLTPREMLRRVYLEVVKRRSSVRVVPARETTLDFPPVFIIGVYRSGTTLLRYIIDSHSRLCCPPESNFIHLLEPIIQNNSSKDGLAAMGFDREHVLKRLRHFSAYFFVNYALSRDKVRWVDKSTSYVDIVYFLEQLFPEAQFLMIYRHGLDQAHSYSNGGKVVHNTFEHQVQPSEDPRLGAVRYWKQQVEKMLDFEERHPDKCFRIIYEKLCESPEVTLRPMFGFLNEPWESDVMEFQKFDHDKGPEHGRTVTTKGFSARKGYFNEWPKPLVEQCFQIATPVLRRLGYEDKEP